MAPLVTSPPASLRGTEHPRVDLRPHVEVSHSLGDVAVELTRRAGQTLEPWQQDSINVMMSVRPDGKWACFEYAEWVARQNGKGAILECRALAGLLLLGEMEILWSAHEYKTAMLGFRRLRWLIRQLGVQVDKDGLLWDIDGVQVKIHGTHGEEGFERLDTEARIKFVARSKGSGRGFSGDLIIIDEAFAYTAVMHDALLPTLLARPNGQIVFTSTPPLTGGAEAGEVMYDLKVRAEAGGDDGLGYRDWGVAGTLEDREKLDLDDPRLWVQSNPALGLGRVTLETIRKLKRSMGELGFAREVLCLWPKRLTLGGIFEMKQWSDCADVESQALDPVALAVATAKDRTWSAIAAAGRREDGKVHVTVIDYRPNTDWVVGRLAELAAKWSPCAVGLDPAGPEGSLIKAIEEAEITTRCSCHGEQGVQLLSAREFTQACGLVFDNVKNGRLIHLDQGHLNLSVERAQTKPSGDGGAWVFSRKLSEVDISPLIAVAAAAFLHAEHGVEPDYDVMASIG